jgi:heme-degrading monooxygenase HmoA
MIVIRYDRDIATGIDVFTTSKATQSSAVASLVTYAEDVVRRAPGFVAGMIQRSLDDVRVVLYTQWHSQAARRTCLGVPETQALYRLLQVEGRVDANTFHLLGVDRADQGADGVVVQPDYLAHLHVIAVEPSRQQAMLAAARERKDAAMHHPGLVALSVYRGSEGTRVAECGLWRSREGFEAMRSAGESGGLALAGGDAGELHLYEIAAVIEA